MRPQIAVIGSGIAGLSCARSLAATCDVTVFEARARPGGHVRTVECQTPDGTVAIDTGFIVFNDKTYPHFSRMLDELGVRSSPTAMSFSVRTPTFTYGSATLSAFFADRRSLLHARHYRFIGRILRFLLRARRDLGNDSARELSLPAYLARFPGGDEISAAFAVPLASSLWSMAPARIDDLPAETFLRFLEQHGMLHPIFPPTWRTITAGSRSYVDALLSATPLTLATTQPVRAIVRRPDAVDVIVDDRPTRSFDRAIVAVHADRALSLLDAPTEHERRLLGAFRYSNNDVTLHTDESLLPPHQAARASWNYDARSHGRAATVTYWMNRLQQLTGPRNYCVTLNATQSMSAHHVINTTVLRHPILDFSAIAAQPQLGFLQGARRTYFCGAYFGFGFHEDGVRSGLQAGARCLADLQLASRTP